MATITAEGKICKSSKGDAIETRSVNTQQGPQTMMSFRISVYQGKKKDGSSDNAFYKCLVFGQLADNAMGKINAEDMVVVAGDLKIEEWQTQNGETRLTPTIIVKNLGRAINRFKPRSNNDAEFGGYYSGNYNSGNNRNAQPQRRAPQNDGYTEPQEAPQSLRNEAYPDDIPLDFSQYESSGNNTVKDAEIPF